MTDSIPEQNFKYQDDFTKALQTAVNHDGDREWECKYIKNRRSVKLAVFFSGNRLSCG